MEEHQAHVYRTLSFHRTVYSRNLSWTGQSVRLWWVKAGKLAPHAARRPERLQAVLAGRGEWLFHSNELQRSHVPARKLCLRAFEPARRMRRKPPVLTPPEPCNLPRSALTQSVKERNC